MGTHESTSLTTNCVLRCVEMAVCHKVSITLFVDSCFRYNDITLGQIKFVIF